MKTNDKCWWLLALLVLAVTACGEEPTGPDAADPDPDPAFAKGGNKPGGGGKPSGDIALKVVFADGMDRIRSDGDSMYVHGDSLVSAIIRTNGMFYFQSFAGKKRDEPQRWVTVDLSSLAEEFSPDDLLEFWEVSDPVFEYDVTLHTRDADGGLYAMAPGDTLVDGGKIALKDPGDGSWEWRLLFDTRVDVDDDGVPDVADGVGLCVTHPDNDTWRVTAEDGACGGAVDGVTELWRHSGGVFTHVADFNTPMHLTLLRK